MQKGEILKVKTKTRDDIFGTVYYEMVETGLKAPEQGRENKTDGVKCVMIGGSGPSARLGFSVIDSEKQIRQDIAAGITELLPASKKEELVSRFFNQKSKEEELDGSSNFNLD